MDIRKQFNFASGWSLCVECVQHGLMFTIAKGEKQIRLFTRDTLKIRDLRPLPEDAADVPSPSDLPHTREASTTLTRPHLNLDPYGERSMSTVLLGARIGVEEDENGITLHSCPSTMDDNVPVAALMAHYRIEKAGENAVRVSTYMGYRGTLTANSFSWMSLRIDKDDFDTCYGYDPDYKMPVDQISHGTHFGSMALSGRKGWIMLTDCGEVTWTPAVNLATDGLFDEQTSLCSLSVRPGSLHEQELTVRNKCRPFSAVIAFGEGVPKQPELNECPSAPVPPVQGTRYELRSGRLTAAVCIREKGASILGISLDDFSAREDAALLPLARLLIKDLETGTLIPVSSEQDWERVRVHQANDRLCIYLEGPHGLPLSVAVEALACRKDAIEWRTTVLNSSPNHTVLSATYPGISFAGGENIAFFKPVHSGQVEYNAYAREESWQAMYPTGFNGVCPVLGVYNPEKKQSSGLYVAVHSPAAARFDMSAGFFRRGQGYFCFDYPAESMNRPANSFELSGRLVVRVLDGDWYDMAEIYGKFVHNHAEWCRPKGRTDSPAWMRDVPMYIMDWMPNDNPDADPVPISIRPPVEPPRDNWYKAPIKLAKRLDLPIGYHLYNWHFNPFNNDFPYYFPVKEGLDAGVAEMHKYGIHIMPYINGRIVDTRDSRGDVVRFNRVLRPGATKNHDGSLNLETYASHEPDGELCHLAAMCPTDPVWRVTLADVARRLFEEYHMDAVYIDQVAAARSNLCCDPSHSHAPGNGEWWVRAYRLMIERIRQEMPEGRGLTSESNSEPYADQFDGFLTWAWVTQNLVPFFPKVYAGRIAMFGRNTNGYKKVDGQYCRFHIGQAVMFGQQIGWINADVVDNEEKIDFLERMCHMRWDYRDYFSRGEMLRPPVIKEGGKLFLTDSSMGYDEMAPANAVVASAWKNEEENRVIIAVANSSDEELSPTLKIDLNEYKAGKKLMEKQYGEGKVAALCSDCLSVTLSKRSCLVIEMEGIK